MSNNMEYFIKDDGVQLPVSLDKFLLPLLSPTTKGTNFWESPPPSALTDRQRGRIILQVHQILDTFKSLNVDLSNKNFVDIGTGNGMVPRLMLEFSDISKAVGADPFLDGEHKTSWQPHDHDETLKSIRKLIDNVGKKQLDFSVYSSLSKLENMSFTPQNIDLPERTAKSYRFAQVGAHDMESLNEKFDLLYCKAIEHIPNWEKAFKSISNASKEGAVLYLKHRPFFSYLGAHRYASIGIPWGHVFLTDSEFARFVNQYHPNRADEMIKFFLQDLAYPRYSVTDMLRIAQSNNFIPMGVKYEPPRYISQTSMFINEIDDFWNIIWKKYPRVSAEEIMCGMVHVVLKKVGK